jgi:hypothetical protein
MTDARSTYTSFPAHARFWENGAAFQAGLAEAYDTDPDHRILAALARERSREWGERAAAYRRAARDKARRKRAAQRAKHAARRAAGAWA